MVKVEVEIPQYEYVIISTVAKKLGIPIKKVIQQEVDVALNGLSVWVQRAELIR